MVALARQRSAEEPDLVADDVAARRAGHAERGDAELRRARAQERSADTGSASPAGGGRGTRGARLGRGRGLAAVPERQQSSQRSTEEADAMHDLGVDHGRHGQQRRHAACDQVELARGVRAGMAVGQMTAHTIGLLVACHASDVGVEVAAQAAAALAVVVVVDQVAQARPAALGDLAELLHRPAKPLAELVAVHAECDLTGQDEALIGAQLVGEFAQASEVMACGDVLVDVGRWVGQLRERRRCLRVWIAIAAAQGVVECRLHRAATPDGAPAVADAGEEPLFERVGDVGIARKASRARARASHQFKCRLAETVLEVLPTEPVTMHPQKNVALGCRHPCDGLGGIAARSPVVNLHGSQLFDAKRG
jgi:hypothetical protein